MKNDGLSYPTHFLKIGGSASEIILLNFRDDMFVIHKSLQIKQKVYSIGTFRAHVATQFIV